MADGEIERSQAKLLEVFRPLIDVARPVALVDFPDSANSGDHAIWLGEKALLRTLGARLAYQCSVGTYNAAAMREQLGDGTVLMHGGGNFGDIYTLYHNFRLQVLRDFPNNEVILLPQTVMFYSDEALRLTVAAVAAHGRVTLTARDVLSFHILQQAFAGAARVVLAPDMAFMIGPIAQAAAKTFNVVWISRTDAEGVHGASLAEATGLQPRTTTAELAGFADGILSSAAAEVAGQQLLASDWYRISVKDAGLEAYRRHGFDERAVFWVDRAVRLMAAGRVVVTDRLHGHILCTLAGIPHVLLNNSYGKNVSYFESWSRPSELCRLAATPKHAWAIAQQMLAQLQAAESAPRATDVARWSNPDNLHEAWRHRSERAAHYVSQGARVLDVGCGKMAIEAHLPAGSVYIPHDVVARDARTRVTDLNAGQRPDFEAATHISVLGVLEYLNDAEGFWTWLRSANARVILTYVVLSPAFPSANRRAMGWFNDFSRDEILALAARAGFDLVAEEAVPPDNILFVFDPKPAAAEAKPAKKPVAAKLR